MFSSKCDPVPFFDWSTLFLERADEYRSIIDRTASAGAFILQSSVADFETALARYLGVRHAIGLADCTNAMLLGLRAAGLAPGDEVILPSHAFLAAAQAIHFAGAVPVPVEISEDNGWLLDPSAVCAAITGRTRAIMAVHVNGRLCPMEELRAIGDDQGLMIFEDAAQALGARHHGVCAGAFGLWGAFSFYPSKSLGCFGDAGALVTNDDRLAQQVRAMRNHGAGEDKAISGDCEVWGTNCRLDNIQAAILASKLGWYDEAVARRRRIAARYDASFAAIGALDLPPPPDTTGGYFDIFQNYEMCCDDRDGLRAHLSARGVGTIVQWGGTPIHQFRALGFDQHLPRTDRFFDRSLLIPMNHLLTDDQVSRVVECVQEYFS
ncbi:MAG TPA: DegT/DnrJ/EryC1/StrS family aminotransferase [Sphingomicrobium sp.]|nr:DegT/DnrJ/EryC1/StrS family aminotransferase [Sphingomicrobium sp.]